MSIARGETDRIRCDVSGCRTSIWFGGVGYGYSSEQARRMAPKHGWSIGPRDLCPRHAYLADRTNGSPDAS